MRFLDGVLDVTRSPLLLDLHNLHANAVNFGESAVDMLDAIPCERIGYLHLAGGHRIRMVADDPTTERLLDDHVHPTPAAVLELLERLAARCPYPMTVIVERDGRYPPFEELLRELELSREAIARGRRRRFCAGSSFALRERSHHAPRAATPPEGGTASNQAGWRAQRRTQGARVERLLAEVLTRTRVRERFSADPVGVSRAFGLDETTCRELGDLDRVGLELAARSFARKRRNR